MKASWPRAAEFYSPATARVTPVRPSFSNKLLFVYVALALDIGAVHWASRGGQARTADALAFHLLGELYVQIRTLNALNYRRRESAAFCAFASVPHTRLDMSHAHSPSFAHMASSCVQFSFCLSNDDVDSPFVALRSCSFQVVTMLLSIISFLLLVAETYLAEQGFYACTLPRFQTNTQIYIFYFAATAICNEE